MTRFAGLFQNIDKTNGPVLSAIITLMLLGHNRYLLSLKHIYAGDMDPKIIVMALMNPVTILSV
jgi:hypothetical protein